MSQDQEKRAGSSCHGNHSGKGHYWHMIITILCCLIPLGIMFLAPQIGIPIKFSWLASLICPVMMAGMMVMMFLPHKEKK